MNAKTTKHDTTEMQRRIDEGIRLAQARLVQRARHDDLSLVVMRDGELKEIKANEI